MPRATDASREIDKFIGEKIHSLRVSLGLSRQQLASMLDITHQQLQKYETGTNRISASKLLMIARALDRSVSYFYDTLDPIPQGLSERSRMILGMARNLAKITDDEHLNGLNILIRKLAGKVD